MAEEQIKALAEYISCIYQIWYIIIGTIIAISMYLYKKKCEKNIFELILNALQGNNRSQNAGVLIFMVLLIVATSDELIFKIIGMLGSLILIAVYLLTKAPIEDLSDELDSQTESANTAEEQSVLNATPVTNPATGEN